MDQFIIVKKGMTDNIRTHIPQMGAPKYILTDLTHSSNTEYIVEKMIKYPPGNKTRLVIVITNPDFTQEDRDILMKEIRNYNNTIRKNFKEKPGEKKSYDGDFIQQKTVERTQILTYTEFAQVFGITPQSSEMETWSLICSGAKNEISHLNGENKPMTRKDKEQFLKLYENLKQTDVFGQWGDKPDDKIAYLKKLKPYYPIVEKYLQFEREIGNDTKSYASLNAFLKDAQLGKEWQPHQTTMIMRGMISRSIIEEHKDSGQKGNSIRQIRLVSSLKKTQKFEPEKYTTDELTEEIGNIISKI